jgi:hypothetical protein
VLYGLCVAAFALLGFAFLPVVFGLVIAVLIALVFVIHGLAALFVLKVAWILTIPLFDVVLLTQYEDPICLGYLERAIRAEPTLAPQAAEIGVAYLAPRSGRDAAVRFLTETANVRGVRVSRNSDD